MAKYTMVTLEAPHSDGSVETQEFNVIHAENILKLGERSGWRLPKDSPWGFNPKEGLYKKQKKNDNSK